MLSNLKDNLPAFLAKAKQQLCASPLIVQLLAEKNSANSGSMWSKETSISKDNHAENGRYRGMEFFEV